MSDNPIYQKNLSELLHFPTLFDDSCEGMCADLNIQFLNLIHGRRKFLASRNFPLRIVAFDMIQF